MKGNCIFCGKFKELVNQDGMCRKCEDDLIEELNHQYEEDLKEYEIIVREGLR